MADEVNKPQELLLLEAPSEKQPATDAIKLDVGSGEAASLYDRMGPTVVNSDGVSAACASSSSITAKLWSCWNSQTLSRIANWAEMTPPERERILRVLGSRNKLRLDAKKQELASADASSEQKTSSSS